MARSRTVRHLRVGEQPAVRSMVSDRYRSGPVSDQVRRSVAMGVPFYRCAVLYVLGCRQVNFL